VKGEDKKLLLYSVVVETLYSHPLSLFSLPALISIIGGLLHFICAFFVNRKFDMSRFCRLTAMKVILALLYVAALVRAEDSDSKSANYSSDTPEDNW
jgi:hypothetical protein